MFGLGEGEETSIGWGSAGAASVDVSAFPTVC